MKLKQSEQRIREIHQDLLDVYGEQEVMEDDDGLRQLLITILSQNVADENTDRAARRLYEEYTSYEDMEEADIDELADVINPAGLPQTKAERIQRTIRAVKEESGEYSVEFLREWSEEDAQNWLENIKGIGPKTASILMNFHFQADVMPVDTHVERVSKRFRLVPFTASNKKAHDILNEIVPDELKQQFHMLLITHGRNACSARNPECGKTKLKKYCSRYEMVENGSIDPEDYPPE